MDLDEDEDVAEDPDDGVDGLAESCMQKLDVADDGIPSVDKLNLQDVSYEPLLGDTLIHR